MSSDVHTNDVHNSQQPFAPLSPRAKRPGAILTSAEQSEIIADQSLPQPSSPTVGAPSPPSPGSAHDSEHSDSSGKSESPVATVTNESQQSRLTPPPGVIPTEASREQITAGLEVKLQADQAAAAAQAEANRQKLAEQKQQEEEVERQRELEAKNAAANAEADRKELEVKRAEEERKKQLQAVAEHKQEVATYMQKEWDGILDHIKSESKLELGAIISSNLPDVGQLMTIIGGNRLHESWKIPNAPKNLTSSEILEITAKAIVFYVATNLRDKIVRQLRSSRYLFDDSIIAQLLINVPKNIYAKVRDFINSDKAQNFESAYDTLTDEVNSFIGDLYNNIPAAAQEAEKIKKHFEELRANEVGGSGMGYPPHQLQIPSSGSEPQPLAAAPVAAPSQPSGVSWKRWLFGIFLIAMGAGLIASGWLAPIGIPMLSAGMIIVGSIAGIGGLGVTGYNAFDATHQELGVQPLAAAQQMPSLAIPQPPVSSQPAVTRSNINISTESHTPPRPTAAF